MTARRARAAACGLVLLVGIGWLGSGAVVGGGPEHAAKERDSRTYVAAIYRRGPGWVPGRPFLEQPSLAEHGAFMEGLDNLVLGGAFKDDTGGIAVFAFENLEAAERTLRGDPILKSKVCTVELHEFFPTAPGCVEKQAW